MIDNIKHNLETWNWQRQIVGEKSVPGIIAKIKNGEYKTKKVNIDLSVYNLASDSFNCPNLFEFITHMELTNNADLKYPVIINNLGQIIDGRHRLCKAIIEGRKKLKGIMILNDNII